MINQFIPTVLIGKYVWSIILSVLCLPGNICTALFWKYDQIVNMYYADREIGYDQQFICTALMREFI